MSCHRGEEVVNMYVDACIIMYLSFSYRQVNGWIGLNLQDVQTVHFHPATTNILRQVVQVSPIYQLA